MKILLIGGGGGGGSFAPVTDQTPNGGGGGGGGGTYVNDKFEVCPGDIFDVVIGAGGNSQSGNGGDGENTVLYYTSCTKLAIGGKGGQFGVDGGAGGQGGQGTGTGTNGNNGSSGTPSTGGFGGSADIKECPNLPYGTGGLGGSDPSNPNRPGLPIQPIRPTIQPSVVGDVHPMLNEAIMNNSKLLPNRASNFNSLRTGDSNGSVIGNILSQNANAINQLFSNNSSNTPFIHPNNNAGGLIMQPFLSNNIVKMNNNTTSCINNNPKTECSSEEKSNCKCNKDDGDNCNCCCCPCPPEVVNYDLSPLGNSGQQGYAKLEFYSAKPIDCDEICVNDRVQNIKPINNPSSSSYLYYIDPNASEVFINTSSTTVNALLGKPLCQGATITVKMLYQNGLPVNITTATGGTFTISAANPSVTLVYMNCTWEVLSDFQNVLSFYPTTQTSPTLSLTGLIPTTGFFPFQSVAINSDGNVIAVGIPSDNNGVGAVFVFEKNCGCWTFSAKLIPVDILGDSSVGFSVAISADGNTIAFGGPSDNGDIGAAWVFIRCGCIWKQQGTKLVPTGVVSGNNAGFGVAMTADGNTLFIGVPGFDGDNGEIAIFTRPPLMCSTTNPNCNDWKSDCKNSRRSDCKNSCDSCNPCDPCNPCNPCHPCNPCNPCDPCNPCNPCNTGNVWTQTNQILGLPDSDIGINVAVTPDGSTLATVGFDDLVAIYFLVDGVYTIQALLATPYGTLPFTNIISLSADGNTLAVGQLFAPTNGGTTIYVRNAGVWSVENPLVFGVSDPPSDGQGFSVSLSADGNTLAASAISDNDGYGATWIFTRVDGIWTQKEKLVAYSNDVVTGQGFAVALSSEGNNLAITSLLSPASNVYLWVFQ